MSNYPLLIEKYDPDERDRDLDPQVQLTVEVGFTESDQGLVPDLASLLEDAGIKYEMIHIDSMAAAGVDWSSLTSEVLAILGSAGGLGGIAAALKAFFGRHKGKAVMFGEDGEVLQADGLSVDDIIRLIETLEQMKRDVVDAEIMGDEPNRGITADEAE